MLAILARLFTKDMCGIESQIPVNKKKPAIGSLMQIGYTAMPCCPTRMMDFQQ
jgi:hypothetical protein